MNLNDVQMLQELPADLRAHGWQFERSESTHHQDTDGDWYVAEYARPLREGVDARQPDDPSIVHERAHWFVRVSSNQDRSQSWEAAQQVAITRMRAADAQRQELEQQR
jgi:hypothetical protein